MTKEQREERKAQRIAEQEAKWKRFPGASVLRGGVASVRLNAGNSNYIYVGLFDKSKGQYGEWDERIMLINEDLASVAELIRGLVARYNYYVEELNETVAETAPLAAAERIAS